MIRLYIDEDAMDQDLVRALRVRGVDVITALDANMTERSDEEHLLWTFGGTDNRPPEIRGQKSDVRWYINQPNNQSSKQ